MCFICDGGTFEEYDAMVEDHIRVHGWSAIAVGSSSTELPYVYTLGLEQSCAHPELVVVGTSPDTPHLLDKVARHVRHGATLRHGEPICTPLGTVEVREVHPSRATGSRFAMIGHWAVRGHASSAPPRRPLQLVLGSLVPPAQPLATWRLDLPEPGPRPHRRGARRPRDRRRGRG